MSSSKLISYLLSRKNNFENLKMGRKRKKAIPIVPHGKIMEINESVVTPWILA